MVLPDREAILSYYYAVSEKLELKEAFSKRYARHRVAAIQASQLWRLLKGNTKRRTLHAHVVPATGASCAVKEGEWRWRH